MSFFDPENAPKKPDADPRVRASGWNNKKLGAFGDDTYSQKARQAQSNSSSIVGGKIVRPIHAKPRGSLPSNVHGFNSSSNASDSSWTGSYTNQTDRQRNPPVGATNFARNAPSGVRTQPGPSTGKTSGQTPTAKKQDNVIPPHLRRASTASGPSMTSTPSVTSNQKMSKHGTRAAPSMNSGTAAKSAKHSSRFPCSYEDCTQGFEKEGELKVHKGQNHDYCRVCDEDFDDDAEFLYHKINSEYHICCCICGQDFRSEGGRDRHERQLHSTKQQCTCVGCGYTFDKGSALIDHIYENKCRDRNDRIPKLVNEETIRKQRAQAALHLDVMSHLTSDTSRMIAEMQPSENSINSDNDSVGGVSLGPKHILDLNEPMDGTSSAALSQAEDDDAMTDLIDLSDNGTVTPKKSHHDVEFPSLGEAARVNGKSKKQAVVDGFDALSVSGSKQGTGATMVDYRQAIITGEDGEKHVVKTDWDHVNFKRHAVDGHYHCPFSRCTTTSLDVNDMKKHLTSGIHQGTDHRCLKCLRHFKTPAALVAHMESNSERCRIKETDHFGQMLSVVSGGFLGVSGRHADGTIKISALTAEELEEQAREHRALLPYEDVNYNWSL